MKHKSLLAVSDRLLKALAVGHRSDNVMSSTAGIIISTAQPHIKHTHHWRRLSGATVAFVAIIDNVEISKFGGHLMLSQDDLMKRN